MRADRMTPNRPRTRPALAARLWVERLDARFLPSVTWPYPVQTSVPVSGSVTAPPPPVIALPSLEFCGPLLTLPPDLAAGRVAAVDWGDGVVTPGVIAPDAAGRLAVTTERVLAAASTYQVTVTLTAAADPGDQVVLRLTVTTPTGDAFTPTGSTMGGDQVPRAVLEFGSWTAVPPAQASPESGPSAHGNPEHPSVPPAPSTPPPPPATLPPPPAPPPAAPPPVASPPVASPPVVPPPVAPPAAPPPFTPPVRPTPLGNFGFRPTPAPATVDPPVVHPGSQSPTDAGALMAAVNWPPAGTVPLLGAPAGGATFPAASMPAPQGAVPVRIPGAPGRSSAVPSVGGDRSSVAVVSVAANRAQPATADRPAREERGETGLAAAQLTADPPPEWHGVAVAMSADPPAGGDQPRADPCLPLLAGFVGTPAPEAVFAADPPADGSPDDRPNRPLWRAGRTLFAAAVGVGVRVFWTRTGRSAQDGGGRRTVFDEPVAVGPRN